MSDITDEYTTSSNYMNQHYPHLYNTIISEPTLNDHWKRKCLHIMWSEISGVIIKHLDKQLQINSGD